GGHAEPGVVGPARGPPQPQETADALGGQRLRRLHHLVEEMALLLAPRAGHGADERVLAELGEGPPQLRLKEHDEGEDPEGPEVVEKPARAVELEAMGEEGGD